MNEVASLNVMPAPLRSTEYFEGEIPKITEQQQRDGSEEDHLNWFD